LLQNVVHLAYPAVKSWHHHWPHSRSASRLAYDSRPSRSSRGHPTHTMFHT
jgi:hypothetical protein